MKLEENSSAILTACLTQSMCVHTHCQLQYWHNKLLGAAKQIIMLVSYVVLGAAMYI